MRTKISSRKQLEDFVELVSKVREAQRLYYRTRSKDVLSMSISLEKKLDIILSEIVEVEAGQ